MEQAQRILVLTTNHVGNNLFCTPAIRLLKQKRPQAILDVVASSKRGASVFDNNPDVNRVYCTTRSSVINRLAKSYDLVIGLHHDKANEYLQKRSHEAVIIPAYGGEKHRAEETLDFMQDYLRCEVDKTDYNYVLCPRIQDQVAVQKKLKNKIDDILIGVHLGSGRTSVHGWKIWYAKRAADPRLWPLENYIQLAQLLLKENPNIRFVLTGARNERFLAKKFIKAIPNTIDLVGKTSLLEMTALMQQLKLYITQDTGPLHVACASHVPIIGLFGPTQPERTGPYPLRSYHTLVKKENMMDIQPKDVLPHVIACLKQQ